MLDSAITPRSRRSLLADENGSPYIFECTDDGLLINGVRVR
jgi:hypothetical protein